MTDTRRPRELRVLYLIPATNLGGEELSTLSLVQGLASRGYRFGLATSGGSFIPEFEKLGVRIHRMGMDARRPPGIVRASRQLRALLRREPYDLLHAQEVFPTVIGQMARRWPSRLPIGLIYHYRGVRPHWLPYVARALPRMADHVVTNSETIRTAFVSHGVRSDRIETIYNGFIWEPFDAVYSRSDVRREWNVPAGVPVAGVIARLHPVKGHRVFLRAAATVARTLPDAHFALIGDGPIRPQLETFARECGVADRVRFLGFQRDIPRVLAGLDLVVLPSTEEAIGRALVEAHAVGLPAIASRVGGTCEVVEDGVTGHLVPPGDPGPLASRMIELLGDLERARAMGKRGRIRVRRLFGFASMIDATDDLYRALIRPLSAARR